MDTLRLVGLMLQRQQYQIIAVSNGAQGLAKAVEEQPDLILLDVMMPEMDGYEVARRLRKDPVTASIPILMFTAKTQLDDKVAGFEVGADDYLTKPTHPTELLLHVKALLSRVIPKHAGEMETASQEKQGYVIGIFSARSGLGVTSVAVNLAAGLFAQSQADVILAELTPGQGTLALELGLPPQNGLTELLQGTTAETTHEKVQSLLMSHSMGAKILAASDHPRDVDLGSRAANFEALVAQLATLARFIVLDLGSGLSASAQRVLPLCAEYLVVMEGTANSIRHTRLLLDELAELKIDLNKISIVLNNRIRSDAQIPWAQVQKKLGHPVTTAITPLPEVFTQAARLQTPAIIAQPASMISQQIIKIADGILEREKAP